MLVHLSKPWNGSQIGFMHPVSDGARIGSRIADIGNAAALDDDFLIGAPCPRADIEQPAYPERRIGWQLAKCDERQFLANRDLDIRIEANIVDGGSIQGAFSSR